VDDQTLCAAILHDTVEDTPYSLAALRRDFGTEIATMVAEHMALDRLGRRPGRTVTQAPFFGDDRFNAIPQTEVATVTSFQETAQPGPLYCAIGNAAPVSDTARYNVFPPIAVFGSGGVAGATPSSPDLAGLLATNSAAYTDNGKEPAYVLVTPTMRAYAQAYGVPPVHGFAVLLASLAHSRQWKLLVDRAGTIIYELPPRGPGGSTTARSS
jgi:hypothetical protein